MKTLIGFDIGGANLKLSDGDAWSKHDPFPLWQMPEQLSDRLRSLVEEHSAQNNGASADAIQPFVTMTGELTDCFANKREGVSFIVDAVERAFPNSKPQFYLGNGDFVGSESTKQNYLLAAASNWHALTSFAAQTLATGSSGLLIDVGSTTTDIIPFVDGEVVAIGNDDYGRLTNDELLYTAAIRTHVPGILQQVTHRGTRCPIMNELFGTTLDCNIILGNFAAGSNQEYSADGKPTQTEDCIRRLARFVGKDDLTFNLQDAQELASQVFDEQVNQIANAATALIQRHDFKELVVVSSGQGEFYVQAVVSRLQDSRDCSISTIEFTKLLGETGSSCATAYAIANLAKQSTVPERQL